MALSNLPAGVDNSHPNFHNSPADECPECGAPAGDEIFCQACGAVLDPEEAAAEAHASRIEDDWRGE